MNFFEFFFGSPPDVLLSIDPLITATLIGAGASLIGGMFSSKSNKAASKASMKQQHQYDLENMAIANQYNIDAFNRENEYNTPRSQRERMAAAGLNPNWVDGGMSAIAQQDSGLVGSSASPVNNQGVDFQAAVSAGLQAAQLEQSRRESNARIDKLNAEKRDVESQIRKRDGADTANVNAQTTDLLASAEQRAKESKLKQKEIDSFEEKLDAYITSVESQNRLNDVMADVQSQKLPKELEKMISESARNNAEAKKALNDIVIAKIQAANDTQRVKNDTQRVKIEGAQQQENVRHNKEMESIGRGNLAIQRELNNANIKYIDANTYQRRLANIVDYELYLEDVPQNERRDALRELNQRVNNLRQVYRTNEVKEDFNQWMLRELIRTGDWNSIQLQKIFHVEPFE